MKNTQRYNRSTYAVMLLLAALFSAVALTVSAANNGGIGDALSEKGQLGSDLPMVADAPSITQAEVEGASALNCRYGMSVRPSEKAWLETISAGWFVNFNAGADTSTANSEYVHTVRIRQRLASPRPDHDSGNYNPADYVDDYSIHSFGGSLTSIGNYASNNPGEAYLIGNEPDRFKVQDDMHPEIYARAYHDIYYAIKNADPTAEVGIAGLVQVTPGRLQYLDIVYDTYRQTYNAKIPVDVWNMHLYILPEVETDGAFPGGLGVAHVAMGTDYLLGMRSSNGQPTSCLDPNDNIYCYSEHDNMDIARQQVIDMRQWMKDHGEQDKPLVISEWSLLLQNFEDENGNGFSLSRSKNFLTASANYFETAADPNLGMPTDNNKLVQQWMWFSAHNTTFTTTNILVDEYENMTPGDAAALTIIGQEFRNLATDGGLNTNLVIDHVQSSAGNGSAEISVVFRNNGNTAIIDPVTITFYSDAAETNAIGSITVQPVLQGCARDTFEASFMWTPGSPGLHNFYVKVDSANNISETTESDNSGSGTVLIDPTSQLLLPILYH